jgi:hypothetical protein
MTSFPLPNHGHRRVPVSGSHRVVGPHLGGSPGPCAPYRVAHPRRSSVRRLDDRHPDKERAEEALAAVRAMHLDDRTIYFVSHAHLYDVPAASRTRPKRQEAPYEVPWRASSGIRWLSRAPGGVTASQGPRGVSAARVAVGRGRSNTVPFASARVHAVPGLADAPTPSPSTPGPGGSPWRPAPSPSGRDRRRAGQFGTPDTGHSAQSDRNHP